MLNEQTTPKLRTIFSANFIAIRKECNFTQESLSKETGISINYISQIERGEKNLTLKTIEKFAKAFNVNPQDFFELDPSRRSGLYYTDLISQNNAEPLPELSLIMENLSAFPIDKQEKLLKLFIDMIKISKS